MIWFWHFANTQKHFSITMFSGTSLFILRLQVSHILTKPTKRLCTQQRLRSAWASAQSDQGFAVRTKKAWVLSYLLSAQRRLCVYEQAAQADLSLSWVHSHFVAFVMRRLKLLCSNRSDNALLPKTPSAKRKQKKRKSSMCRRRIQLEEEQDDHVDPATQKNSRYRKFP